MSIMNQQPMQQAGRPTGYNIGDVVVPKLPPPPAIFDQSQQPTLGSISPRNRPQPIQQPIQPVQEGLPRLPPQQISPSPELMAQMLARTMFSGRR